LLFGDEKGEQPGENQEFARFLDKRGSARPIYTHLLREHFQVAEDEPLPHHTGHLMFYPTFFDLIDVEVINPHSRKTRAGTHPIYLECVPDGANGAFSLLYVPLDLIGWDAGEIRRQAAEDLRRVAQAVSAMLLIYGFSAKRSSGYGTAENKITGLVRTRSDKLPVMHLEQMVQEVHGVRF
jgi:CRISPR-associated protein Cmr2